MVPGKESNNWVSLDVYREMKIIGKVLLVRPSERETVVPLFCPLCKFSMKTSQDSASFRNSLCCERCYLFSRGNPSELPEGHWEEYLKERESSNKPLFNWK